MVKLRVVSILCLAWVWSAPAAAAGVSGQTLAAERCAACHGADGNQPAADHFPRLAGQQIPYLLQEMKDYRDGRRTDEIMQAAAQGLTEPEIQALAEWYGKQAPMTAASSRAELMALGRKVYFEGNDDNGVPACNGCHEDNGAGFKSAPRVAGQNPAYTVAAFARYVGGQRPNGKKVMRTVAKRMSEAETVAVAEFMATLK